MKKKVVFATVGGLGIAALASVGALSAGRTVTLTPEEIVQSRQAGFDMSAMTIAEMKAALNQGSDIRKQFYAATSLARWARAMPSLFPAGTAQGETDLENHASSAIWKDRPGFETAAKDYAAQATKLSEVARGGDAGAFEAQLRVVNRSCDSCHFDYSTR